MKRYQIMIYVLYILSIMDLGLTNYGLSMGYIVEANPIMAFYADQGYLVFSVVKLLFNTVCCYMLYYGIDQLEAKKRKTFVFLVFLLTIAHILLMFYHFYGILFLT